MIREFHGMTMISCTCKDLYRTKNTKIIFWNRMKEEMNGEIIYIVSHLNEFVILKKNSAVFPKRKF